MFIIGKQEANGTLTFSPHPVIHPTFRAAQVEANRLGTAHDSSARFIVFARVSTTRRIQTPLETVAFDPLTQERTS